LFFVNKEGTLKKGAYKKKETEKELGFFPTASQHLSAILQPTREDYSLWVFLGHSEMPPPNSLTISLITKIF